MKLHPPLLCLLAGLLVVAGVSCSWSEETSATPEAPVPAAVETPAGGKRAVEAPALPAALPSARAVLERFVEVTKIKGALEKTKSMHLSGTFSMESMGMEGPTEVWSAKPDQRLVSVEMGALGTMLVGYDGNVGWSTHPMMGARLLKGTELLQLELEASYDSALKPDERYESLRNLGRETFDGKECFKLELVAKPHADMDAEKTREVRTSHEFYEIATGYLIGTKGKQEGELGGGPFTQVASDYKEFGGALLATKIKVQQSSQEVTMTFDEVEFDSATETTFALPAEVKKMVEVARAKDAVKPQ